MGARQLIKNGKLQGDLDCANFRLLNIGDSGSGGPYVPITRTINGHNLSSDIVLDLATDFGLSVSTVGLNLLALTTPAATRFMTVGDTGAVAYLLPVDVPEEIGLGVNADVTFGNVFVPNNGDFSGLSSHFTVGKSTDSTQYLDFNNSATMAIRNKSGTGALIFITSGLTVDRAFTLPNASGTLALTSDLVFVSDTAYDATSWNGVTTIAPSKNAVRDKIESMNPMTTTGDLVYGGASGAQTRLAGNTTTSRMFLSQTGNGVNSAAPAWHTVDREDIVGLGPTSDAVFGNVFVGTAGDFSGLGSMATLGASMDSKNFLVMENDAYLYLEHRATSFGVFFDTSLLDADRTHKFPNRTGTLEISEWLIKTANYTAKAGDKIQADTLTTAAFTITLPASPVAGDSIPIEDANSNWASANLTIARNGNKINGATSNYTGSTDDKKLSCVYIDASYGWSIK